MELLCFFNKQTVQNVILTDKELEPLTSGLKVPRSTDWANRAYLYFKGILKKIFKFCFEFLVEWLIEN